MTDPIAANGRATQQQLYTAIGEMRAEMHDGFRDVRGDIKALDTRLRSVEHTQISEQAHDDERELVLREQREIRAEQGVSRRWLAGLVMATMTSIALSLVGIFMR